MPEMNSTKPFKQKWIRIGLLVLIAVMVTVWLMHTPDHLDGKLDAVGYAVCHQIESHTLSLGGKLLPLCARCTGMYLGAIVALSVLASGEKRAGKPSKAKVIVLGVLFLAFLFDSINSTLTTFLSAEPLYPPSNLVRLATGLAMGVILVNLILPMWNQTLWQKPDPRSVLHGWKQFLLLLLCEVVVGVLIWLDVPLIYYPVAILSTGTIFVILGMVYSLLWCIILNKENTLERFKDGWTFYLLGVICAFLQIGLMDLLRFSLTGSWGGFQL